MRVALLTNFVPPYRISLFEALRAEVGDLRVFASTAMEGTRAWRAEFGALDVVVQKSITLRRKWKSEQWVEPYELHIPYDTVVQLRRYRPDVIVTGELGMRSLQALLYGKTARVPVVLWATLSDRIETARGGPRRALRKLMIPRFNAVIVNGEAGARYIRRFRSDEPVRVPYTTDMAPLLALPLEGRSRELLYVGSLTERKGFDLLLRAVREHGFRLTVVGDGPLRQDLHNVRYAGNVEYGDLRHWFEQAGFLIMPSRADEWGVVVNEALAAGVPVIGSTYSQAVDELIEDGVNGWRFEPRSEADVAAAIRRAVATSDADLMKMRAAARRTAQTLDPESAARRIAELLKSL